MIYSTVAHVSWVGSVLQFTDPAQHLTTIGYDLDDLCVDRDLSDV